MKKFTVVTPDAKKIVFETEANTFGELKQELSNRNISLEDKTIFEGLTKIDITKMDDNGVLPHDVMYKGVPTNDLVFMLTASKKKIKSGMTRQEIITEIKSNGLCDKVKETFGKNYTNVSTDKLMTILSTYGSKGKPAAQKPVDMQAKKKEETKAETPVETTDTKSDIDIKALVKDIVAAVIPVVLAKLPDVKIEAQNIDYSDAELEEMFKSFK